MTGMSQKSRDLAAICDIRKAQKSEAELALAMAVQAAADKARHNETARRKLEDALSIWHDYLTSGSIDPDHMARLAGLLSRAQSRIEITKDALDEAVRARSHSERVRTMTVSQLEASEQMASAAAQQEAARRARREQDGLEDDTLRRWKPT